MTKFTDDLRGGEVERFIRGEQAINIHCTEVGRLATSTLQMCVSCGLRKGPA